jgi:two-component system response regulator AtoC
VRQLRNLVERLVVLTDGERIDATQVQRALPRTGQPADETTRLVPGPVPPDLAQDKQPLREYLRQAERVHILRVLDRGHNNRTLAAKVLGISRRTLYYKIQEHGIE